MTTFDSKYLNEHVGKIITWVREIYNEDSIWLASKIAISQGALSQLEAGKRRLAPDIAARIARAFEIEPTYLTTLTIPAASVPEGKVREKLISLQQQIQSIIMKAAIEHNANREANRVKQLTQPAPIG